MIFQVEMRRLKGASRVQGGNKAMVRAAEQQGLIFKVECTWCGAIIRRSNVKDSRGMCLKCYARMLSEHGRPLGQDHMPRWASER
jgi:hypothetical protein